MRRTDTIRTPIRVEESRLMTRKYLVVTMLSAMLSGAGCYSYSHESSRTSPSTTAAQALGGVWATAQSLPGTGAGGTTTVVHELLLDGHRVRRQQRIGHVHRDVPRRPHHRRHRRSGTLSGTSRQLDGGRQCDRLGAPRPPAASRWPARRSSAMVRFASRTPGRRASDRSRGPRFSGRASVSRLEARSSKLRARVLRRAGSSASSFEHFDSSS